MISKDKFLKKTSGKEIYYMAGIDFGGSPGHDFVYKVYACDVTDFKREVEESLPDEVIKAKIIFYVIYEYRSSGNTTEFHVSKIKEEPNFNNLLAIWADPSAKQSK